MIRSYSFQNSRAFPMACATFETTAQKTLGTLACSAIYNSFSWNASLLKNSSREVKRAHFVIYCVPPGPLQEMELMGSGGRLPPSPSGFSSHAGHHDLTTLGHWVTDTEHPRRTLYVYSRYMNYEGTFVTVTCPDGLPSAPGTSRRR